jgi:branched-chain amino acid transport system substrate-binding protein
MKRLAAVVAALAATLTIAGCGGSESESTASTGGSPSVKIGLVGPETGPVPQYYTDLVRPVELAVGQLADEYGVDVEIVEADDQATPDGASQAVQKLLNEDNVDVIFGPPLSGNGLQVAEVIQRTGRPWFLPSIAPELINDDLDPNWAFRTNYNSADLSAVVGQLMFTEDSTVGVVYSADSYGQSGLEAIEAVAEEQGAEIAASESIQPGATDFNAGIARLEEAGVTQVFLAITAGADTSTVTKAIVQSGLEPDRVVTNATILADFSTLADPAQWENLIFIDPRDLTGDTLASIAEDYEAEYGEAPILPSNVYSVMAGVDAYLQAVSAAGSGQDYDQVREELESLDEVHVDADVYEAPFAAGDHELYEADDEAAWYVFGFDAKGTLENRGTIADCLDAGC